MRTSDLVRPALTPFSIANACENEETGGRQGIRTPGLIVANDAQNLVRRCVSTAYAFRLYL